MLEGILGLLGYIKAKDHEACIDGFRESDKRTSEIHSRLYGQNQQLTKHNTELMNALKERNYPVQVVDINISDPEPSDQEARREYAGTVAGFHKDFLQPKMYAMIGATRSELERVQRETFGFTQTEFDMYLKGTINAFWLVDEWGLQMRNEVIADNTGDKQHISKEETDGLRDKLNE